MKQLCLFLLGAFFANVGIAAGVSDSDEESLQAALNCQEGLTAVLNHNKSSADMCKVPSAPAKCIEQDYPHENLRIMVQALDPKRSGCTVNFKPVKVGRDFREIVHSQEGGLTYFDNGSGAGATFYLYPRRQMPSVRVVANQAELTLVTGDRIYFDTVHVPDASSPTIKPDPHSLTHTLILDSGVNHGSSPTMNPEKSSTFKDSQGGICPVKNDELYNYDYFKSGKEKGQYPRKTTFNMWNPEPKYLSDAALWKFLQTRCPGLKLPHLF